MTAPARLALLLLPLSFLPFAPAAGEVELHRDLTSVLMLLGLPCGQVIGATPQGEDAHVVECSNGSRYRVFLDADGRVVARAL